NAADRAAIEALWRSALQAAPAREALWLHGDVHARNLLVDAGRISGVIDWGDLCAGDPATDLAGIWMNFHDREARASAQARYETQHRDSDSALWHRARGWAALFAAILIDTGRADHPRHAVMGERTLENLLEG
ncbi:MAG: phosphotransferase, partial [Pseudomonadota bacterium]